MQSTNGFITTTTTGGGIPAVDVKQISYPFTFLYDQIDNSDGTFTIVNKSDQKFDQAVAGENPSHGHGWPIPFIGQTTNEVISSNNLYFDASGNYAVTRGPVRRMSRPTPTATATAAR